MNNETLMNATLKDPCKSKYMEVLSSFDPGDEPQKALIELSNDLCFGIASSVPLSTRGY